MGCPLASKRLRLDQLKAYPLMVRQYCIRLRKYRNNHPDVKAVSSYFADEYEQLFRDLFCETQQDLDRYRKSLFKMDFKAFIENYFNIKL